MSIPVTDEGFRYGRGVFETLSVIRGRGLFQDWHEALMIQGAKVLGLDASPMFFIDEPPAGTGVWRWYLTESGIETTFDASTESLPAAYSLSTSSLKVNSNSWDARYKTLSYLLHIQAREQAATDEVVLLNQRGELASASMANLFWVRDGVLFTPEVEAGCRQGVIRRWVLENTDVAVRQGRFKPSDLTTADEIFLTNSRMGIMPVHEWESKPLKTGAVTSKLWKAYTKLT
jgi:branched-subunit amino acid aminotransferase/4-amino-4-deoxychorismate lyase